MIAIQNVSARVSGTISFSNLTDEAYQKLQDFVDAISSSEATSVVVDKPLVVTSTPPGTTAPRSQRPKSKYLFRDDAYALLDDIFNDAAAHPENYEYRWCSANDFKNELAPRLDKISLISVGRYMREHGYGYNENRDRRFPIPLKKSSLTAKAQFRWCAKQGRLLMAKRREYDFTLNELSEKIGYSFYIIQGWESGTMLPSPEAMKALAKVFGNEFIKELNAS